VHMHMLARCDIPACLAQTPAVFYNVAALCNGAEGNFVPIGYVVFQTDEAAFAFLVPYLYLASGLAMDKSMTKRMMDSAGIPNAPWRDIPHYTEADIPALVEELEVPCAVKVVNGGSSIGVAIAHNRQELEDALRAGLALGGHSVIEQYISGREIQVGILEDRALPSIEIIPKVGFYDYENKYQPGAADEICPAEIPQEWENRLAEAALTVFRTLGLSVYSRADFIVTEDGTPWFLEINTLPGMTPTSLLPQEAAAVGIEYGELCERIIQASIEARKTGK